MNKNSYTSRATATINLAKLTQAQADALEAARSWHIDSLGLDGRTSIIKTHVRMERYIEIGKVQGFTWGSNLTPLNTISLDILIIALYAGYEVHETPEERIKEYYKAQNSGMQLSGLNSLQSIE